MPAGSHTRTRPKIDSSPKLRFQKLLDLHQFKEVDASFRAILQNDIDVGFGDILASHEGRNSRKRATMNSRVP